MSDCGDLVEALNNLSVAFTAGCCDGGSYGAGKEDPPPTGNGDNGEDPPPGFDTYEEYRTYKCDIANRLVEGVKEDIDWVGAGSLSTLVASAVIPALLTPVPFDDILVLIGYAVSLLLQGILATTAATVSTAIVDNREALVCILYDAPDPETARDDVSEFMDTLLTTTESALFDALWSFAAVNALFDRTIVLEYSPLPDAVACDECSSECLLAISADNNPASNGTFTVTGPLTASMSSALVVTTHWGINDFNTNPDTLFFCGPGVTVASYNLSGFTPFPTAAYRLYEPDGTLVYNNSIPPNWSLYPNLKRIQLKSTTPFTGSITVVPWE